MRTWIVLLSAMLAAAITGCAGSTVEGSKSITFVDLNPPTADGSASYAISGNSVVGSVQLPSGRHAAKWTGTAASFRDLNPSRTGSSVALGVSGSSVVISGGSDAYLWRGSNFVNLTPPGAVGSSASGISGNTVVGSALASGHSNACIWSGTAASSVDLFPEPADSYAMGVFGNIQVGYATIPANFGTVHAGMWSGTAASFVDLHPAGATQSDATSTDGTTQVGNAAFSGFLHAVMWNGTAASYFDLNPPGSDKSSAEDVSGNYIVGYAAILGNQCAVVWNRTTKTMLNLQPVLGDNWVSSAAYGLTTTATGIDVAGTATGPLGSVGQTGPTHAILWHIPIAMLPN